MKKTMLSLFMIALSIMVLLSACGRNNPAADVSQSTNQNINEQGLPHEQNNTNIYSSQLPNKNSDESPSSQEQIAGVIQSIDGMHLTIDTSQVFMSSGGQQRVEPGTPVEKQDTIIRLTEQTTIEVRTTAGGQITDTRAGTMDDLSLQTVVMADGEWQGDEFIAVKITLFSL